MADQVRWQDGGLLLWDCSSHGEVEVKQQSLPIKWDRYRYCIRNTADSRYLTGASFAACSGLASIPGAAWHSSASGCPACGCPSSSCRRPARRPLASPPGFSRPSLYSSSTLGLCLKAVQAPIILAWRWFKTNPWTSFDFLKAVQDQLMLFWRLFSAHKWVITNLYELMLFWRLFKTNLCFSEGCLIPAYAYLKTIEDQLMCV